MLLASTKHKLRPLIPILQNTESACNGAFSIAAVYPVCEVRNRFESTDHSKIS